jgi:hypothetical protein
VDNGYSDAEIAELYCVGHDCINDIRNGKSWKGIQAAPFISALAAQYDNTRGAT